jgi:hypothetical protein
VTARTEFCSRQEMALFDCRAGSPVWSSLGEEPTSDCGGQNDVNDPSRQFGTVNCRNAKGSFDHTVSCNEQASRHVVRLCRPCGNTGGTVAKFSPAGLELGERLTQKFIHGAADLLIRLKDAGSIKVCADLFEHAVRPGVVQVCSQDLLYIIINCSPHQP